jgi:hypothetical protein
MHQATVPLTGPQATVFAKHMKLFWLKIFPPLFKRSCRLTQQKKGRTGSRQLLPIHRVPSSSPPQLSATAAAACKEQKAGSLGSYSRGWRSRQPGRSGPQPRPGDGARDGHGGACMWAGSPTRSPVGARLVVSSSFGSEHTGG